MLGKPLLETLLALGHSTSQNLAYVHQRDVHVAYGEEMITETNLLEINRRHSPHEVSLRTFSKRAEARNGADWQWHIIGKKYTFLMLIQAKRVQRDHKIKIHHRVKSSGNLQLDELIGSAKSNQHIPVYCFYSPQETRQVWRLDSQIDGAFELGCLLASAHAVKKTMPKRISEIERQVIPWHYLASPRLYRQQRLDWHSLSGASKDEKLSFLVPQTSGDGLVPVEGFSLKSEAIGFFPTFSQLNSGSESLEAMEGIIKTNAYRELHPSHFEGEPKLLARRVLRMHIETD